MINGLKNTCEGCPLITILEDDYRKVADIPIKSHEISAMSSVVAQPLLIALEIDKTAQRIGCKNIEKELPPPPEPMPPLGHPERIAYGRNCLAYLAIKNNS